MHQLLMQIQNISKIEHDWTNRAENGSGTIENMHKYLNFVEEWK